MAHVEEALLGGRTSGVAAEQVGVDGHAGEHAGVHVGAAEGGRGVLLLSDIKLMRRLHA